MQLHYEVCKDHDFFHVKMPDEEVKWLSYGAGAMAIRVPFTIYADLECILKPIDRVDGDPEKPYTRDVAEHVH
ncbi:hypothetical protein, partial [Acinetobacter baumannii]|uniref:hypothetical protein n=1 Tax=Acinetobacter baumannii TaxID=470 RepID=UPI001C06F08D